MHTLKISSVSITEKDHIDHLKVEKDMLKIDQEMMELIVLTSCALLNLGR